MPTGLYRGEVDGRGGRRSALARARAAMDGRTYVVPDDVAALAVAALGHRVLVSDSDGSTTAGRAVVAECVAHVPAPTA